MVSGQCVGGSVVGESVVGGFNKTILVDVKQNWQSHPLQKNLCQKTLWFVVSKRVDLYHIKFGIINVVLIFIMVGG